MQKEEAFEEKQMATLCLFYIISTIKHYTIRVKNRSFKKALSLLEIQCNHDLSLCCVK